GGGVLSRLARAYGARDDLRELRGARDRLFRARAHDRVGHATREALFSEPGDHLANLVDARTSEPRRNGLPACRIHAHVERAVRPEAETARWIVELRGGDTEVEEHATARAATAVSRHERCKLGKRRVDERKPHFVGKTGAAGLDGLRVPIEREH